MPSFEGGAREKDQSTSLGQSARSAIVWGVGFTIIRDLLQFTGTIILVRLLTPGEYGRAALALTILSLVSAFSFKSVILYALQVRDPAQIDWQSHFTGGLVINLIVGAALLLAGGVLSYIPAYAAAAPLVSVLSVAMLSDLFGGLRFAMVQTQHDWLRFRVLLLAGAVLAMGVSIIAALLGAGSWALLAGTVLLNVPATLDLLLIARWRPNFRWPRAGYVQAVKFGLNRAASSMISAGRQMAEHSTIVAINGFAPLGIFTRSFGLSTMVAGRIGLVATQTLYPVLTRSEARTKQFQRAAGLLLAGAAWVTIPSAAFLACNAYDIVLLLYGPGWIDVSALLPLVSAVVGVTGLTQCASQLLLANERSGLCLQLESVGAVASLILIALALPQGIEVYLGAYAILAFVLLVATSATLVLSKGIAGQAVTFAFGPPVVATGLALGAVILAEQLGLSGVSRSVSIAVLVLLAKGLLFFGFFVATLKLVFPKLLHELLSAAPGGQRTTSLLRLRAVANKGG